jgi:hypothetical protein
MNSNTPPAPTLKHLGLALMIMAALMLAACSGGSGGSSGSGSVSALSLPDRIELTNVQDQNASSRAARAVGLSRAAYNDTGTDYANQTKSSWVDDTDALDMINTVLGVCKETSYASFVNQGSYKALVRNVDDSKQAGSGSSTTSSTTEELMEIYVNVTRASNSAPMIVKIWLEVPSGPNDVPMLVRGYFEVSQGVSTEYPYGVMTAHFKGNTLNNDGSEGEEVMQMALSVDADNGQVVLENVDDELWGGNYMQQRRVQVVANADVTEGNAYVMEKERDWNTNLYPADWDVEEIAFNSDYFKVTTDTDTFYAKDNLKHRVFNYKLFDATTGDKIELSSGFPIQTAAGKHGYVGYYGLWAPYGTTIASGDTVTDMDGNEFTVFRSSGKLTKHTQASMLLSALDGVELSKWSCSGTCQDTVVAWESDTDQFLTLGYRNSNGQIVYYVDGQDAEYHTAVTFQQWEGAYCESLQAYLRLGNLYFDNSNGGATTPTDASTVYYHIEQTLNPSTASAIDGVPLYTWEFTMSTPIGQTEVDNYDTDFSNYWGSQSEKTFYFDAATMMLTDGSSNPITLGSLDIDTDSNLNFGYHIGPLTTAHYYENASPYVFEAQEAPVYYSWNTGSDDWNQLVTVKDSNGDFVSFDAPISFSYTHTTANDVNGVSTYNGKTFRLQYDGFSVQIPWNYDETTDEWEPFINIADGTPMGPNGDDYVIKATEESLVMTEIADPSITFPSNSVGEPTLTYDATKTALVGDAPITAELKVIKGEVLE